MVFLRELLRFGVVGTIGFLIDGGLLWGLISYGINPYLARIFSFPLAVVATWWMNRLWTFKDAAKSNLRRQINRYFGVQIAGALTNFIVYLMILSIIEPTTLNALAAFALGSIAGLAVNFAGSRKYVFQSS